MTQEIDYSNVEYKKEELKDMVALKYKHGAKIQYFLKTAMHMEDTESCMITLPCRNAEKKLMILVAEV